MRLSALLPRVSLERIRPGRLALEILVIAICLAWLSPFYLLFVSSFKSLREIGANPFSFPTSFELDAYTKAWKQSHLGSYFKNSLIISGASVVISVFLSSLAAYAFSRLRFIGKQVLFFFILAGVMLPLQATLVPLYRLLSQLGLISTYWGMIALYVAFTIPFGIFLLTGFFRSIPYEIEEAAMIDGCSWFGMYWRIVIPLAAPGLATMAILEFIWFWNEYLLALTFIQKESIRTVTMGVMVISGIFQMNFAQLTAATLMSLVPVVIVYILFQRYLIRGLTAGALK
jgi:raffinose/stachyose/melibiose transport system permease protein